MLKQYPAFFTFLMAACDSLSVLAAYLLTVLVAVAPEGDYGALFEEHFVYFVAFVLVWCVTATDQRLFSSRREDTLLRLLMSVLRAVLITLVISGFLVVFLTRVPPDTFFFTLFGLTSLAAIMAFRLILRLLLWWLRRKGFNYRNIILVGANERSEHLANIFAERTHYGYHVHGVLEDEPERTETLTKRYGIPHIGRFDELEYLLTERVVDEVHITLPVRSQYERIMSMAHLCEGIGVPVRLMADLFPLRIATSTVHHLEDIPMVCLTPIPQAQLQLFLKRAVDFAVSSALLAVLLPFMFLPVAIAIKLESRGPVFFSQERVGLNQRRFNILKFRSMVQNAEELRSQVAHLNEADGPVFKARTDPRITRVGAFLRKYSIDEFPQLINVWLGHMSLVGPRPPLASEVAEYTWNQRRRLSVKPGMTGLWQISGRSDVTFDEWVELDLAYIDSWSLAQDIRILVKTFRAVIEGRGAA
ncbi:MAG: sugar transferase [Candidatus Hydrogenedentota bacterium]